MLRFPDGIIERGKRDGNSVTCANQGQLGVSEIHLGAGHIDLRARSHLEEATGALQILVAITALPYLIMRYFAGGVNMPLEVAWLGIYVLFGLVTTAVMLGLSWFRYFLVRAIIMLAVLAGAVGFCAGTIEEISRTRYELDGIYRDVGWPGIVCLVLAILWAAFFFLDIGAAQIAPLSENRSTRRRLAALLTFFGGGGCILLIDSPDPDAALALGSMLMMTMLLPCVQALCERPAVFAPVLRPFVKRGIPGRLAGRILYPGWHTGLFFNLLVMGTAAGFFVFLLLSMLGRRGGFDFGSREMEQAIIIITAFGSAIGAMIFPVVVWRLFRNMEQWNFWRWLLVMLCIGLFHMTVMLIAAKSSRSVAIVNYLLPSGGMLAPVAAEMQVREEWRGWRSASNSSTESTLYYQRRMREEEILIGHSAMALFSLSAWLTIAIWLALREFRETRRAEDELIADRAIS